jgi:type VI secretion system protein ImpK
MMPDDPFAGLGLDRTVIMPVPGGRSAPARPVVAEPPETQEATTSVVSGLNPLIAAANPLLDVVAQLRGTAQHPNPTALHDSLARGVREFEAQGRNAGIATEQIIAARYALCTLIDETATSTPWGASGAWAQHGLLALFHGETGGGEKFFQLMAKLAENPHANRDLLELMYVCLQLGFEGRYRIADGGQRQLEAVRQRLLSIIRKERGEYERELSPSWRGVPAGGQRRLTWLPLWVIGAVAALLLVAVYAGFNLSLSRASDRLAADIASLRVAARITPRASPEPRLAPFLAEEVRRGLVAVDDRFDRSVVTILGDAVFKPGEAVVSAEHRGLVARIAEALANVPGQIDVVGHTDNAPIRTLRFPSNWELSRARAESVATLLAVRVAPARLHADGRGETEPLAANDTAADRARNRRVEITLRVPAAEPTPKGPGGAARNR